MIKKKAVLTHKSMGAISRKQKRDSLEYHSYLFPNMTYIDMYPKNYSVKSGRHRDEDVIPQNQ